MIDRDSRYAKLPILGLTDAMGREIAYITPASSPTRRASPRASACRMATGWI